MLTDEEFDDELYDPVEGIIEDAKEIGVMMTRADVERALADTDLEADDISLNQAVIDGSEPKKGKYRMYKGGSGETIGWVTSDPDFAAQYGEVSHRDVNFDGQTTSKWTIVHDWDGNIQLVPPGPLLRHVYDDVYLLLS